MNQNYCHLNYLKVASGVFNLIFKSFELRRFSILRRPWFHFLLIGATLYLGLQLMFPPPKPVLGPPSNGRIDAMIENFIRATGGSASAKLKSNFIDTDLRNELLFQEALKNDLQSNDLAIQQRIIRNMRFLDTATSASDDELLKAGYALGFHLSDEVIRRRLTQVMERLIVATSDLPSPSLTDIQKRYQRDLDRWKHPPRYTFSHVFLPANRNEEMPDLVSEIDTLQLDAYSARLLGAPFLSGYDFQRLSIDQVARVFGASFAERLAVLKDFSGSWVGPIESPFGLHYVLFQDFQPSHAITFGEAKRHIERDLIRESEILAIDDWVERVSMKYEVRRF